ncbi:MULTISPECIES: serine hydrolase domain-containing protein [Brevibacterium]|nr:MULTISPECIES: serine hydrolase domain-containing protein [Brevibacterium]
MMSIRTAASILVLSLLVLPGCGSSGPETIDEFIDETAPSGSRGVVAVADGESLVHCDGWGTPDGNLGTALDCDTVVDVMSMTKQFTAAAILKLQMLGMLEVSDSIGDYLGPVPDDKHAITIEHLLTHTSGFVDQLGHDYDPMVRDELVSAAMASTLGAEPGSVYAYSNLGYSLLAAIVEIASGTDFEDFLRWHLFMPAGMSSTGYRLPDWDKLEVAVEYDRHGRSQGTPLDHEWADDGPWWNLRGNGGLLSTAEDMYRWHLALRGDGILGPTAKSALFKPRVREEPHETHYGFGWVITDFDGRPSAWHNGGNTRSYGELLRTIDGEAMVFWVATQAVSDEGQWDMGELGAGLTDGILSRLP